MEPSKLPNKQYGTIVIDNKTPSVLGSSVDAPTPPGSSIRPDAIQAFPKNSDGSRLPSGSILALPPPPPWPQASLIQPQLSQQPPAPIQSQQEPPASGAHDEPPPLASSVGSRLGSVASSTRSRTRSRSKSRSSSRGRKQAAGQPPPPQRPLNLPRAASRVLALSRDRNAQSRAKILRMDIDQVHERYPYCLVWTPLPLITWLLPLIGHSGISNSRGLISDFSGDFRADLDNLAFGAPTKYYQFDPDEIDLHAALLVGGGGDKSASRRRAAAGFHDPNRVGVHVNAPEWEAARRDLDKRALVWDGAIREASEYYKQHKYNLYFRNCHAYIACVLNKCNYAGASDWTSSDVWWMVSFMSSYTRAYGCLRQWSLFVALFVVGLVVLVVLLAS